LKPYTIRITVVATLIGLLAGKFLLLAPAHQLDPAVMNNNFEKVLIAAGATNVKQSKRDDRADQHRFEFTLNDCPLPYVALQGSTLEDLKAVIDHAVSLPQGVVPHVFYLGKELGFDDRLGLKLTAVTQFIAFRLGLSSEMPSGNIYLVLAKPGCESYRQLEWSRVWAL
jgi:hypothetical protein